MQPRWQVTRARVLAIVLPRKNEPCSTATVYMKIFLDSNICVHPDRSWPMDIDNNNVNSTLLFVTLYVYCIGGPTLPDLTHALPPAAQTSFLHFKVCSGICDL